MLVHAFCNDHANRHAVKSSTPRTWTSVESSHCASLHWALHQAMLLGYGVTLAKKGRVLSSQPEILAVKHPGQTRICSCLTSTSTVECPLCAPATGQRQSHTSSPQLDISNLDATLHRPIGTGYNRSMYSNRKMRRHCSLIRYVLKTKIVRNSVILVDDCFD